MRAMDKTILATVSLSLSAITATLFLLWLANRRPDLEFAPSLGLSVLVGLVVPLALVAIVQRLRPQLKAGWLFAIYFGACGLLSAAFALGIW